MKKRLFALALIGAFLFAIGALPASAAETVEMPYGSNKVTLTPVEDFETGEAAPNYGYYTVANHVLKIESTKIADAYGLTTEMFPTADFNGVEAFVFAINNRSDGAVFFCFQPLSASGGNLFLSDSMPAHPALLVTEKGVVSEATYNDSLEVASNRYGCRVPGGFHGYLVIPVCRLVSHGNWDTPYFTGALDLQKVGFSISVDDATYIELTVKDMYSCGALPELTSEPETKPAAEAPTVPATEKPQTQPATEPVTVSQTATEPVTEAPSTTGDTGTSSGCGSTVAGCALTVFVFLAGGALTLKKSEK